MFKLKKCNKKDIERGKEKESGFQKLIVKCSLKAYGFKKTRQFLKYLKVYNDY